MEMVRLFQLQLEHYEKVEGTALSLEGKANQLSMMIRGNLQAAMMGLAVVPIFAGYDLRRSVGRLWAYDVTGGRYEEREYVATGLRQPARRHRRQGRLPAPSSTATTAIDARLPGAVGGGRRRLGHRRARRAARHLPDRRHDRRRRLRRRRESSDARAAPRVAAYRTTRCGRPQAAPDASHAGRRMSMPFYVAPEQVMKDRADYARKGIARGRALVAVRYADGIAIVAENSSETLRKVSEIYDRIAFAGVGKYNEFDQLRVAGVRAADLKGFQYSRDDVDARSLANQYAQILGQIFTHEMKPMEVEILVAEVGVEPGGDQMFHILYDGTVFDHQDYTVLGGDADAILGRIGESFADGLDAGGRRAGRRRRARRPRSHAAGRRPRGRPAVARQRPALLPPAHRRPGRGTAQRRLTGLTRPTGADDRRHALEIEPRPKLGVWAVAAVVAGHRPIVRSTAPGGHAGDATIPWRSCGDRTVTDHGAGPRRSRAWRRARTADLTRSAMIASWVGGRPSARSVRHSAGGVRPSRRSVAASARRSTGRPSGRRAIANVHRRPQTPGPRLRALITDLFPELDVGRAALPHRLSAPAQSLPRGRLGAGDDVRARRSSGAGDFDEDDPRDVVNFLHEVVHADQVRRYGGESGFACEYGKGYVEGGGELPAHITEPTRYHRNPLEAEAYSFEARFQDAPGPGHPELDPVAGLIRPRTGRPCLRSGR